MAELQPDGGGAEQARPHRPQRARLSVSHLPPAVAHSVRACSHAHLNASPPQSVQAALEAAQQLLFAPVQRLTRDLNVERAARVAAQSQACGVALRCCARWGAGAQLTFCGAARQRLLCAY